jgi:2',3'-cyclic-nucleotide 2'-phosphodiesterase (5'-nucleotidase family)
VARRATYVQQQRNTADEAAAGILVLDAGNWLVGDRDPARATQGRTSVEAMNRLGYDAAALGSSDLELGPMVIQQRIEQASFPVVSANAYYSDSGAPLAAPYTIVPLDNHNIAIIGITGSTPKRSILIREPVEAARAAVTEVGDRANIVIILSNVGEELNRRIAAEIPGVDLVIGAAGRALTQPLETDNGILVQADQTSPGHAGRFLGVAELHFDGQGNVADISWQRVGLLPEIPDDPALRAWIDEQN